jgi:hypothetical protein
MRSEAAPTASAWHSEKAALARVIDQLDTWKALAVIYHDADSMRNRFLIDGAVAPVSLEQAGMAKGRAEDAASAAALLYEASETIVKRLAPGPPGLEEVDRTENPLLQGRRFVPEGDAG